MSKLKNKYLILIVGPSASGKSHILNHLTQNGYQRIVSTTTRSMRDGEIDGHDYHFISEKQSKDIDSVKGFVERVDYAGVTYGVTHEEFETKLEKDGVAFLIVEPRGIDKYKEYCYDNRVNTITIYVDTHDSIRFERLKLLSEKESYDFEGIQETVYTEQGIDRIIRSAVNEKDWMTYQNWDYILNGNDSVEHNYGIIAKIIEGLE